MLQPKGVKHLCPICGHETEIPYTPSMFSQRLDCFHCGSTSMGLRASPNQAERPENMQQEELSRLFDQGMTLSNVPQSQVPSQSTQTSQPEAQPRQSEELSISTIVYASSHYTGSSHVTRAAYLDLLLKRDGPLEDNEIIELLQDKKIEPSGLVPCQVNLFSTASPSQRDTLLGYWSHSQPRRDDSFGLQQMNWSTTNLALERNIAIERYKANGDDAGTHGDTTRAPEALMAYPTSSAPAQEVASPTFTTAPPPNSPTTIPRPSSEGGYRSAEPYILSGYELLARREYEATAGGPLAESTRYNQATDPAYKGVSASWHGGDIQDMENQYGRFQHQVGGGDEDMEL